MTHASTSDGVAQQGATSPTPGAWLTSEHRILEEHYPLGGAATCKPLLPRRTYTAINQHASAYGIRYVGKRGGARPKVWTTNAHIDAAIVRAYQATPQRGAVGHLARTLMRPGWWISQRAMELGVRGPRLKEPDWCPAEVAILEVHAAKTAKHISRVLRQQGYVRTPAAIVVKLSRLAIAREDLDTFTASGFARCLGITNKAVEGWIARGLLIATRRRTDTGEPGRNWQITRAAARRFIAANAALVDLRKIVDREWFIELVMRRHGERL